MPRRAVLWDALLGLIAAVPSIIRCHSMPAACQCPCLCMVSWLGAGARPCEDIMQWLCDGAASTQFSAMQQQQQQIHLHMASNLLLAKSQPSLQLPDPLLCTAWLVQGQYNGNSTGFSYQYALARGTDVAIGSGLVMLLAFIAPWYAHA